MADDESQTASIDLAVAFFCSVLVLFVFVSFSLTNEPPRTLHETIAQEEETKEIGAPGWQASRTRGMFGFFDGTTLYILNMAEIVRGLNDPETAYDGPQGETNFSVSSRWKTVGNAFSLQTYVDQTDLPETWIRASLELSSETHCLTDVTGLVTVFVVRNETNIAPLTTLARRCDLRLRYSLIKKPENGERFKFVILLSPRTFTSESVFR